MSDLRRITQIVLRFKTQVLQFWISEEIAQIFVKLKKSFIIFWVNLRQNMLIWQRINCKRIYHASCVNSLRSGCLTQSSLWERPLMTSHKFWWFSTYLSTRALTSILTKYQYTYQVSVYWYLYLVSMFPNTDTSYFKNVLEY